MGLHKCLSYIPHIEELTLAIAVLPVTHSSIMGFLTGLWYASESYPVPLFHSPLLEAFLGVLHQTPPRDVCTIIMAILVRMCAHPPAATRAIALDFIGSILQLPYCRDSECIVWIIQLVRESITTSYSNTREIAAVGKAQAAPLLSYAWETVQNPKAPRPFRALCWELCHV